MLMSYADLLMSEIEHSQYTSLCEHGLLVVILPIGLDLKRYEI